jgi:hypothetical protein
VLRWATFGLLTAGGIGIVSMQWPVALLALPGFVLDVVGSRRDSC